MGRALDADDARGPEGVPGLGVGAPLEELELEEELDDNEALRVGDDDDPEELGGAGGAEGAPEEGEEGEGEGEDGGGLGVVDEHDHVADELRVGEEEEGGGDDPSDGGVAVVPVPLGLLGEALDVGVALDAVEVVLRLLALQQLLPVLPD